MGEVRADRIGVARLVERARALVRLLMARHADRARVHDTTRLLRALTPAAVTVASALCFAFQRHGARELALTGLAIIVVPCLGALVVFPRIPAARHRLALVTHVVLAGVLGLGWSLLTAATAATGEHAATVLVACIQVALVSVGVVLYVGLPLAFAAFSLAPLLALFRLLVGTGNNPVVVGALILGFMAILVTSLVERSRVARAGRDAAQRLADSQAERLRAEAGMADERARQREAERRAVADAERQAATEAERARRAELMLLGERFEGGVVALAEQLARIVPALEGYAGRLSGITDAAVEGARATAGRARDISAAVHDLQSRSESLGAAIAAIADRTADHAAQSGQALDRTAGSTEAVRRLASRAERVDEIVDLIDQVTARTNLLALNATIEAARAGEAGRGFAVVAGEVKALAAQTASSTVVAREQVREIAQSLGIAVAGIEAVGTDIRSVADIAGAIRAEVERQNELAGGMAPATRAIAAHVDEVRDRMVAIAGGADDARELSTGIQASAAQIKHDLDTLKTAAGEFLGRLRAA